MLIAELITSGEYERKRERETADNKGSDYQKAAVF